MASTKSNMVPSGYKIVAPEEKDIPQIAGFIVHYDTEVGGYSDFSEEDLREMDRHPRFDSSRDSWVVTHEGKVVGYARLWEPDPRIMLHSFGAVHPDHTGKGLGSLLLSRIEARALELLAETQGQPLTLRSFVDVKDKPAARLFEAAGFEGVRRHYTMSVQLGDDDIELGLPEGIVIRTSRLDEAPLVHSLIEETFAEHWGHVPMSYEEWSQMVLERSDADPGLWFVAEADSEPVGVLVAFVQADKGWVADLGVRSKWRRRGVGACLLRHCFAEMRRRGHREVGLGVDAGNETGAVALYENVGMRPVRVYETYEKRLLPTP